MTNIDPYVQLGPIDYDKTITLTLYEDVTTEPANPSDHFSKAFEVYLVSDLGNAIPLNANGTNKRKLKVDKMDLTPNVHT